VKSARTFVEISTASRNHLIVSLAVLNLNDVLLDGASGLGRLPVESDTAFGGGSRQELWGVGPETNLDAGGLGEDAASAGVPSTDLKFIGGAFLGDLMFESSSLQPHSRRKGTRLGDLEFI